MKRLWLIAAAVAPLSFAAGAHAATTISTPTTTSVATSTTGDLTITGSILPPANTTSSPVAAVTIDSSNSVTNSGSVGYSGGNLTTGILANGGHTGLITSSGSISATESTTGVTSNSTTGINTGPFANGNGRFGIRIVGPGIFTGLVDAKDGNVTNVIDNSGSITVIGENSAGISIETGIDGGIFDSGAISVTGGNGNTTDVSYGIHATAQINGAVTITGAITATGNHATGVSLEQGLSGEFLLQNTITATGYRTTTSTLNPTTLNALTADQVLQGGPALVLGGNVSGGVVIDVVRTAGNTTPANSAGVVTVFGSAPALLIGGANALTVSPGSNTYGLTIGGSVNGVGDFANFDGNGIQIGGTNNLPVTVSGVPSGHAFGNVTIAGGIGVTGNVVASSVSIANLTTAWEAGNGSTATALHVGAGATVPSVNVSGAILATSAGSAGTTPTSVAIQVDSGGNLTSLTNSGNITAAITGVNAAGTTPESGGTTGTAIAVNDLSGTLTTVNNTGVIAATITPIAAGDTVSATATRWALNLSHATAPVTVTQSIGNVSGVLSNPLITGDVLFGDNGANLNLQGGNLTGAVFFGAGNSSLLIDNGAAMTGALSDVSAGNASSHGQLAVNVNNGSLFMTSANQVTVSDLHVGATGSLVFSADPLAGTAGNFTVSGNATLDDGAKIGMNLLSKLTTPTTFVVIQATPSGNISSGVLDTTFIGQLPFLYGASAPVVNPGLGGNVSITLSQKTAQQLGLNPAESAAYNAIFAAFDRPDTPGGALPPGAIGSIKDAVLNADSRASFIHLYDQFLPDYGGGVFETFTDGQHSLARAEADAPTKMQTDTTRGWVQEIGYYNNEKSTANVNGFNGQGFGMAGGIEAVRGTSAVGVAAAFLNASVSNGGQTSDGVQAGSALEVGAYMRAGGPQGLKINASVNGGLAWFKSRRLITQESSTTTTTPASTDPATGVVTPASTTVVDTVSLWRQANAHWLGAIMSANLGVSYQANLGKRFYVRPEASVDYTLLYEAGHTETGGGDAFDLTLKGRTSQQATVQGDLVFGMNLGSAAVSWQPEVTVGWRQIVVGGPGATTAQFASGGVPFTLQSSFTEKSGLLGRIGVRASSAYADFSADAGGVFSSGYQTYDARAVARFLF